MHGEIYKEETIETYAVTDSSILNKVSSFLGIPIIIVFGWLSNKYMSIFSVDHNKQRLVVIYQGICPVIRDDRLRITGVMEDGGKLGVYGMVMHAYSIENLITGDTYENI